MTAELTATSHVRREIARQPEAWATAIGLADEYTAVLPQAGERIAVVGCGTSWFMAAAYAQLREAAGHGESDYFAASEFPCDRRYDRIVAISRSGTTTEVIELAAATEDVVVAITAVDGMPLNDVADHTIVLDFADEQSVVQTLFATTALMLLRASLGGDRADLHAVVAQARDVLDGAWPVAVDVDVADQVTFLGQGWVFGIAQEAALKMREAAQQWTEAYPQMEYRHGPIAIAQPGRAVWLFGRPVAGLPDDVTATGATLVDDALDPVADVIRAQLLAVSRAESLGLNPDEPRSLTRSVVLDEGTGSDPR